MTRGVRGHDERFREGKGKARAEGEERRGPIELADGDAFGEIVHEDVGGHDLEQWARTQNTRETQSGVNDVWILNWGARSSRAGVWISYLDMDKGCACKGECTNAWSVTMTSAPSLAAARPTRPVPLPSSRTDLCASEPRWARYEERT